MTDRGSHVPLQTETDTGLHIFIPCSHYHKTTHKEFKLTTCILYHFSTALFILTIQDM